jgi:hypothetical protein
MAAFVKGWREAGSGGSGRDVNAEKKDMVKRM